MKKHNIASIQSVQIYPWNTGDTTDDDKKLMFSRSRVDSLRIPYQGHAKDIPGLKPQVEWK